VDLKGGEQEGKKGKKKEKEEEEVSGRVSRVEENESEEKKSRAFPAALLREARESPADGACAPSFCERVRRRRGETRKILSKKKPEA